MFPGRFGGEQLGPIFLAILPGIALLKSIDKRMKPILIFGLAYIVICFFVYQNLRFILPVVPFLSIITAYILETLLRELK